jgi:hypothetical protein
MSEWIEIVGKVGFPVAVAFYLLWQSRKDKEAVEKRVNGLDSFIKNDLKNIAESSIKVNQECADAIKADLKIIEKNSEALKETEEILQECKLYLANKGGA